MDFSDKLCMIEPGKHKQIKPQCVCGRGKPIGRLVKNLNSKFIVNTSLVVCYYCKKAYESKFDRFECLFI